MATKTWTGAGANNNWSTALNWSGGTIPINGDDIIFNGAFPVTGNKDCTYNGGFVGISFNFTGYTGIFTFSSNLTLSGTLTLDIGTTYATSGTPTTYTLGTSATGMTLVSNGKILPVNFATNGGTTTINGNADFQGNFASSSSSHNIKSAAGVPCDLRIGGNIILQAIVTNTTDTVTFKAYGTGKTFNSNGASTNVRVRFVSGSTYTNLGNVGTGGISFFTVESGGQFNALNNTFNFSTSGTTTLSGFNGLSDFMSINCSGTYILLNDTIIKGFIQITASSCTISTSVGAKILLEGNLIAASSATTIIDYLEFSGTSLSTVSAVSSTNLQIKNISFNKTGAGSVNFTSTGFGLFIPAATTYTWTHTAGSITYSPTSVILFLCSNFLSTMVYSESGSLSTLTTINSLSLNIGILQLNSPLRATTLTITGATMTFTGTAGWTCGTWLYSVTSGTIILQQAITYTTTTSVTMLGTNAGKILMRSSAPTTTYAIWTLQNPASQSMTYVSATAIDSSLGMTIYSFGGIISTAAPVPTLNWGLGASQGTKAFTFVS
jgi:hypothetical protein